MVRFSHCIVVRAWHYAPARDLARTTTQTTQTERTMQAIRTRYHGPTNIRGARISAQCEAGKIFVGYHHALDLDDNHATAASELIRRLGWAGHYHGGSFGGDHYWVRVLADGAIATRDGAVQGGR
jgi:hypothetical protein